VSDAAASVGMRAVVVGPDIHAAIAALDGLL
jgi:hypothetical protein